MYTSTHLATPHPPLSLSSCHVGPGLVDAGLVAVHGEHGDPGQRGRHGEAAVPAAAAQVQHAAPPRPQPRPGHVRTSLECESRGPRLMSASCGWSSQAAASVV